MGIIKSTQTELQIMGTINFLPLMTTPIVSLFFFSYGFTQIDIKMLESDVWVGHWIYTQWQCGLEKQTTLWFRTLGWKLEIK